MTFRRDVPLVPTLERIVQLTGRTDLRNLEASGELNLKDLLLAASNTIHAKLQAQGVAPERIVNAEVYENAVAWQFLGVLTESHAQNGEDPDVLFSRSARYFEDVRPRFDVGDEPRNATEGIPAVQNPDDIPFTSTLDPGTP